MARRRTIDTDLVPLGISPRTLFVTGKGGVGKSTVAAATATAYSDAGARTLLVEIEGQASAAALLSPKEISYVPTPIGEHLSAIRLSMEDALREYARLRLKVKAVADRLVSNPVVDQFAHAAPGFRELLVLGKLYALARDVDDRKQPAWDAIVVDAPATGHGLGLINMASVVARMFPVGPIGNEAKSVDAFIRDPEQVGVILVTLAEELPVSEAIHMHEQLQSQNVTVAATLVNSLMVDRFSDEDIERTTAAAQRASVSAPVRAALETAEFEYLRCEDQAAEQHRLAEHTDSTAILPYMFAQQLQREHIEGLARWLTPDGQARLETQLAGSARGPQIAAQFHDAQDTVAASGKHQS